MRNVIILSGGGTGGSVFPLISIKEEFEKQNSNFDFVWVGTKKGIEVKIIKKENIKYYGISSGKLRRYFSWHNFIDIFKIAKGFFDSIYLILKIRPKAVLSAGSFVSVPLVFASWIFRVPILIHQQDIRPGLANKLMSPFANKITVTFEKSLVDYKNAIWAGNPFSIICENKIDIKKELGVNGSLPIVVILGGGNGSTAINNIVKKSIKSISDIAQVVHIYGKGKGLSIKEKNYYSFDFLEHEKIIALLRASDLVVSRSGLGILTEISFLKKISILIPMPHTHQEDNAEVFSEKKAAVVLDQEKIKADDFIKNIKDLLRNTEKRKIIENNAGEVIKSGAGEEIVKCVNEFI